LKIVVFAPAGSVWPKISSRRGGHSFLLSQCTHMTDRQTNGQKKKTEIQKNKTAARYGHQHKEIMLFANRSSL